MLKLVSVNIERWRHLSRVLPFLEAEWPDVVCLQEVVAEHVPLFEHELGMQGVFFPMSYLSVVPLPDPYGKLTSGVAILTRGEAQFREPLRYYHASDETPHAVSNEVENRAVLSADIEHEGERFTVATTHFPASGTPEANDFQRKLFPELLTSLEELGEFALCGDFNAPRGGEIFSELAARYTDNIPAHYTTSLDKDFHYAGDLQLMVDGLFTTQAYRAENVKLVSGVSDHFAIRADILRA